MKGIMYLFCQGGDFLDIPSLRKAKTEQLSHASLALKSMIFNPRLAGALENHGVALSMVAQYLGYTYDRLR